MSAPNANNPAAAAPQNISASSPAAAPDAPIAQSALSHAQSFPNFITKDDIKEFPEGSDEAKQQFKEFTARGKSLISPPIHTRGQPDTSYVRNKHVVITGGAGGLGRQMALKYLELGCYVTIGDLDKVNGEKLAAAHPKLRFVQCNNLSWKDQCNLFEVAFKRTEIPGGGGRIDIVVANAGVTEMGFFIEDNLNEPRLRTLDINLRSQFFTVKLAHYYFRRSPAYNANPAHQGKPRDSALVLLGSMASLGEIPGAPEYTAAKHGMLGLMRSLRRTSPAEGVRVNSIHPWFVKTGIIDAKVKLVLAGTVYADINDVVRAALFLTCPSPVAEKPNEFALANGRALSIMEPSQGVVDVFPSTEDSTGDFLAFMQRTGAVFNLRGKYMPWFAWLKDTVHYSTLFFKWPIMVVLLTLALRSERGRLLWMVLKNKLQN
ncbi:hypothetical protein BCR37DRAFT_382878 [Protomyces lactucae-debilis]|uniref:Uncharacterized protein n=1 Tax=Protomyces lactucae-debilis TaxID=2754530 RepID=A0A1Y2F1J3_PROLT|nr:uncharacterized protein BCR37DRAFT_382878 [Protomyces lactucae-debilis]ORY77364.1 hypothetical protein BCR37DRAFT_382878 [Protomyces lactucae-debilis]